MQGTRVALLLPLMPSATACREELTGAHTRSANSRGAFVNVINAGDVVDTWLNDDATVFAVELLALCMPCISQHSQSAGVPSSMQ